MLRFVRVRVHACVAYLDPRRFRFADVERLAASWRRFVPGRDDLAEAVGDALRQPQRSVDARLLRALALLDEAELSVAQAAGSRQARSGVAA